LEDGGDGLEADVGILRNCMDEKREGSQQRTRENEGERRTHGIPRLSRKLSDDDGHDVVSEVEVSDTREQVAHALERKTTKRSLLCEARDQTKDERSVDASRESSRTKENEDEPLISFSNIFKYPA